MARAVDFGTQLKSKKEISATCTVEFLVREKEGRAGQAIPIGIPSLSICHPGRREAATRDPGAKGKARGP